ncbi:carotenoid cleavage dioxygenase 1 [Akanthomyces lecanii RCEF 1005]|uniref:Carotenoid cleavage dioxygenase 1 n=1 Tax=Akanthomyces lecanii RCEF 1005 TaxID=1081108 RepID=A0A168HKP7_CORDF|nr:carotenoid cleavage dioxygenase 1 [Akanthomyces lecanii RCEF 1005]
MALGCAETTLRRTAQEEEADEQEILQNFLDKKYNDWPNEAGFVGLTEHRGPVKLQVRGTIPSYAAGALYRTGPGVGEFETAERGKYHVSHWFDGFAHTHRFDIAAAALDTPEGGARTTVTYSSRRQGQEYIDKIKKRGWRGGITFAQRSDPCIGLFAKVTSRFDKEVNNNVVVLRNVPGLDKTKTRTPATGHHAVTASNITITTDTSVVQVLHKDTLEAVGDGTQAERFHPDLKGPLSPSHAQRDEETGDLFNVNLDFGRVATYRFFRVNAKSGTTDILATVSEKDVSPAYIHSFFLTQNHVVLCVPSSHIAWSGTKVLWKGNVLDAIKPFDKSALCQWIVVDRRHDKGVVARFSTPAGFFFHSVNAFEETAADERGQQQTYLNLDYIHFETTATLHAMYYDVILKRNGAADAFWGDRKTVESMRPRFVRRRFALPSATTKQQKTEAAAAATEVLSIPSPHVGEMPTINPAYACRPYRYVYSVPSRGLSTAIGECLAKTDLETREALIWTGPAGHTPGEAIFVARPGADVDEDDGVVLSVVLDGEGKRSYLLCLDAKTMTEMGRAEADFPIAFGLHGLHAAADA